MVYGLYEALGTNRLTIDQQTLLPERKTAALLVYLALEGATPRTRIAGLLWPDSEEPTARNNLSQTLRRFHQATRKQLVIADTVLTLSSKLAVDAVIFKNAALAGKVDAISLSTELLDPLDYDDLPEFNEWLWSTRETLAELRNDALGLAASNLEAQGNFAEALGYTLFLIEVDPLSEKTHRQLMRLHYLMGDRAAALKAYGRCANLLQRELGVEPLPETQRLKYRIEQGSLPAPRTVITQPLPLELLRPPQLVGRELAWKALDVAWRQGQGVVVRGPAGIGKSRLLQEFAASKGRFLILEGRPGDQNIPYATNARVFRELIQKDVSVTFDPWVRSELARIAPELGDAQPLGSDTEKLRFYEAKLWLLNELAQGNSLIIIVDDFHFLDAASIEAWLFIFSQVWRTPDAQLKFFVAYRDQEIGAEIETRFYQAVEARQIELLDLEPLDAAAVTGLVDSLALGGVSAPADLAQKLHRYAGGNPFFIIEALKGLLESDALHAAAPITLPPKLRELIARRLQRLSPSALRTLQAASVLHGDFSAEVIGEMLGVPSLELLSSLEELARSGFLQESHFAHDLLFESVAAELPPSAKALLHQRAAVVLTQGRADPARIAEHWLKSDRHEQAIPYLQQAAERAKKAYLPDEAVRFYQKAATLLEAAGQPEQLFDVLTETARLRDLLGQRDEQGRLADLLTQRAVTPVQEAMAQHVRAEWFHALGRYLEGEGAAREGLRAAEAASDLRLQTELVGDIVTSLWFQERYEAAESAARQGLEIAKRLGRLNELGGSSANLGVILDRLNRYEEAALYHRRAYQAFLQDDDKPLQAAALNNLLISLSLNGRLDESLQMCRALLDLEEGNQPTRQLAGQLISIANVEHDLGHYGAALNHLNRGYELAEQFDDWTAGVAQILTAEVHLTLGQNVQARALLEAAQKRSDLPERYQGLAYLVIATVLLEQRQDATEALVAAERFLNRDGRLYHRLRLELLQGTLVNPNDGLRLAEATFASATTAQLNGVAIAAATRCVELALTLGRREKTAQYVGLIKKLRQTYQVTDLFPANVLRVLHLASLVLGEYEHDHVLVEASAWLQEIERSHLPAEYRQSFRKANAKDIDYMTTRSQEAM